MNIAGAIVKQMVFLKSGPVLCEGARHVRISENSSPERRDVESKFLGS